MWINCAPNWQSLFWKILIYDIFRTSFHIDRNPNKNEIRTRLPSFSFFENKAKSFIIYWNFTFRKFHLLNSINNRVFSHFEGKNEGKKRNSFPLRLYKLVSYIVWNEWIRTISTKIPIIHKQFRFISHMARAFYRMGNVLLSLIIRKKKRESKWKSHSNRINCVSHEI